MDEQCAHGAIYLADMSTSFSVGDRVRFLHQSGEGVVQAVEDGGAVLLVEDGDGFPMRFPAKECLLVPNAAEEARAYASKDISKGELLERNVDETVLKKAQKDFDVKYRNPNATNMRKRDEHMEWTCIFMHSPAPGTVRHPMKC